MVEQTSTIGITEWARAEPDKAALVLGDEVRTFGDLDERTNRLASFLAGVGIAQGDPVGIMLPNSVEFFEVGVAAGKLDGLMLTINWHLKSDELAFILGDSGAKVLFVHADLTEHLERAFAEAPDCRVVVVGGTGDDGYEAVLSAQSDATPREADTTATPMIYTSGTTGRPKGVVHSYMASREITRMAMQGQVDLWQWSPGDIHLLAGPAYHAGPTGWTMTALFAGATTIIMPEWDAREWLRLVERHRVTRGFMVPAHFIRILEVPEEVVGRHDLSSLELIVHAGAPCPTSVKRRFIETFPHVEISELYGASEGGASRITAKEWLERPGSVGQPWPGVEVRILDEDGRELPAGEQGLVYVKPAFDVKFHYHGDESKTEQAWRDEAFTVGDIGYLDEDGYLYLTDRASDMVIRGGVNIYPREIEEVLHTHPQVVDCAVFGVPDERSGEELKALVETREHTETESLDSHLRERLADYKVPRHIELVDTLPRDPNGKVLKRVLRDQHWSEQATAISTS
jgi:long-chain acyl-CoA synthetase